MPSRDQRHWEARKQALWSYLSKVGLVLLVVLGFRCLHVLGAEKETADQCRVKVWTTNGDVLKVVDDAAQDAIESVPPPSSEPSTPLTPPGGGKTEPVKEKKADSKADPSGCTRHFKRKTPEEFASPERLIATMQDRVEVCFWLKFGDIIGPSKEQLIKVGKSAPRESKEFAGLAEFISKAESYAGTAARVARKRVEVQLQGMELPSQSRKLSGSESNGGGPPQGSGWRASMARWLRDRIGAISADDSTDRVVYDLLWYAALVVGVISSSVLFLIFLTALPMTVGIGYWTKRMGEILDRLPPQSKSSALGPILATILGGGALVSAIAATEPGGKDRASESDRSVIVYPTDLVDNEDPLSDLWLSQAIDKRSYSWYVEGARKSVRRSSGGLGLIRDSLDSIYTRFGELVDESQQANIQIAKALQKIDEKTGREPRKDEGQSQAAQAIQAAAATIHTDLVLGKDSVDQLSQAVLAVDSTLAGSNNKLAAAVDVVETADMQQTNAVSKALGQVGGVDPRGFFKRSFFPSLYQVGPQVERIIGARIDGTHEAAFKTEILLALTAMRKVEPVYSRRFKEAFKDKLTEAGLSDLKIECVLERHLPAILKASALPRF